MIETKRVKITNDDLDKLGKNIGTIIEKMGESFAKVGQKDGWMGAFGMGDVSNGINSMKDIGMSLSGLATGVQAWGNMNVTEYGIQKIKKQV